MRDDTVPGPHLRSEELAAYLEGGLPPGEQVRIEEHLAACGECRREAVDSFRTVTSGRRVLRRGWLRGTLAAAALLVLVLGGNAMLEMRGGDRPPFRSGEDGGDFERIAGIDIVHPEDGRTVSADSVVFVWRAQPDGTFYRLALTDEAGDVVWRTSTSDTVVAPGADVTLEPGAYFWIVDALLAGGRTATTGARAFRIDGPP